MFLSILLLLLITGVLVYKYLIWQQTYWRRRNVNQGKPIPLIGDNITMFRGKESTAEILKRVYDANSNVRFSGIYQFTLPILLIRDMELIKRITVKDFDHFMDHRAFIPENLDPFFAKNLVALKGDKWKEMRSMLSPSFTGTKMRAMFSLMNETAEQFIEFYQQLPEKSFELEMKDTFTRFANDVIANCAFGFKCNSLKDRDNEFFLNGKEATDFTSARKGLKIMMSVISPTLGALLKARLIPESVSEFFFKIVTESIKVREEQNIVRPDMINQLMEARKGLLKYEEEQNANDAGFATVAESLIGKTHKQRPFTELTDLDITAQAFIFFFAGFDTISTGMTFVFYELAINPDIQEKLREEIENTHDSCEGKLTYDRLASMKYMDMVISESIRKWPPGVALDRICTKSYTIEPELPNEQPLHLEPGTTVWVPTFAIHRDSQYYPDPEKFDPERFSDENKHEINPYAYMPFGIGPRNCIGSRFALMEVKIILYHILLHFEINPTKKTLVPMKLDVKQFNVTAEGGMHLELKKRNL